MGVVEILGSLIEYIWKFSTCQRLILIMTSIYEAVLSKSVNRFLNEGKLLSGMSMEIAEHFENSLTAKLTNEFFRIENDWMVGLGWLFPAAV